jgi:hypothetical protein
MVCLAYMSWDASDPRYSCLVETLKWRGRIYRSKVLFTLNGLFVESLQHIAEAV